MKEKFKQFNVKFHEDKKFRNQFIIVLVACFVVLCTSVSLVCIHSIHTRKLKAEEAEIQASIEAEEASIAEALARALAETTTEEITETTTEETIVTTTKKQETTTKKAPKPTTTEAPKEEYVPPVDIDGKGYIQVPVIYQKPELPSGCEITSLTMVLRYLGYNADKCDLADNYLAKGSQNAGNPWVEFLGDPRSSSGVGCYAPPIVDAAKRYIADNGGSHTVKNISGASVNELYKQIDNGNPVIVWATDNMRQPHIGATWKSGGQTIKWMTPMHCLVLIGYDSEAGTAIFADPLHGIVSYSTSTFEARYKSIGQQAIVIE